MNLILGSGSRFRKEIMESAGYPFSVMSPDIDERAIRTDDPYALPLRLAEAKAASLLPNIPEPSLLVTCDTIVVCLGRVYEKPRDAEEFRVFMREYATAGHADIVTGILVTNTGTGKTAGATDICRVEFDPAPESAIEEFIRTGDPYSRAGGFTVENDVLAPYIRSDEKDRDSIIGLPLRLLAELLAKVGPET